MNGIHETIFHETVALYLKNQFPKACGCGRAFDSEEWKTLKLIGNQEDDVERIEMRDCVCRSTLAVVVAIFNAPAKVREIVRQKLGAA